MFCCFSYTPFVTMDRSPPAPLFMGFVKNIAVGYHFLLHRHCF